ncbi:MAG: hypothetical protein CFE21_02630 [Bacteroidetes bacterium B1(2017)]|nr:MAG: hypothetical protein CFE21_02630 [Bacteroidetes bacterium B1(2017)]
MNTMLFYQALADSLPDMVWGFDENYILRVANPAFFDMRRGLYNSNLKIGDSLFSDVPEEVKNRWQPLYNRGLKGERFMMDDIRIIKGVSTMVRLSLNPVFNEVGEPCGCLGITYDITREAELDLELRNVQSKCKLIHDLNKLQIQPSLSKFFALTEQLNQTSHFSIDDREAMMFMLNQELSHLSVVLNELNKSLSGD